MARKAQMVQKRARHTESIEQPLGHRKMGTAYSGKIKHGKNLGKGGSGFSKDAKK
jgi:hypothetical protein